MDRCLPALAVAFYPTPEEAHHAVVADTSLDTQQNTSNQSITINTDARSSFAGVDAKTKTLTAIYMSTPRTAVRNRRYLVVGPVPREYRNESRNFLDSFVGKAEAMFSIFGTVADLFNLPQPPPTSAVPYKPHDYLSRRLQPAPSGESPMNIVTAFMKHDTGTPTHVIGWMGWQDNETDA